MESVLQKELSYIRGVGPKVLKSLAKIGLQTIRDCLYFFPREYDDRRQLPRINALKTGDISTIITVIECVEEKKIKKGMHIIEAVLGDKTGKITAVWFNQAYLLSLLIPGRQVLVKGKVDQNMFSQSSQIQVQHTEVIRSALELKESVGVVIPVYSLTAGLYQTQLRDIIKEAFKSGISHIHDRVPDYIKEKFNLMPLREAVKEIHFPSSVEGYTRARSRVVFDEFLFYQLRLEQQRQTHKQHARATVLKTTGPTLSGYLETIPYELTNAQKRVIEEIQADLVSGSAMNRLLQGDVGSGKTDVAIMTLLAAIESQKSGVIMAPTEILATQHYLRINAFLEQYDIPCCLLKSKMKKSEKNQTLAIIESGEPCVVVGTHALIQSYVSLSDCGVVVIDEQHRFGVMQRIQLQEKGHNPHCLFMTATPIPRSFMLTCFGDLDKSVLDEMPPGRVPVETQVVEEEYLPHIYQICAQRLERGEQMYIVYPLVEESEKIDLKSAVEGFEKIKTLYSEYKVGLLHGRLSPEEKQTVMTQFKSGELHIIVSTTVIEVGIDVPNATVMLIQHADRFGLSQLHQLRGRVGRGGQQALCFLVSNVRTELAQKRLKSLAESTDGFKIAEVDLQIRGPGDILGTRQAGMPNFNLADLIRDEKILQTARQVAKYILEKDPDLSKEVHKGLLEELNDERHDLLGTHLN